MLSSRLLRRWGRAQGAAWVLWGGLGLAAAAGAAESPRPSLAKDEARCDGEGCALGVCQTQALLRDPAAALAPLRVIPVIRAGTAFGFELLGLRPGSLAARLGLQNGDVLLSLNGRSLANPEAALQALTAAKDEPVVRIAIERKGQPIERRLQLDSRPVGPEVCPLPKPPPSARPAAGSDAARPLERASLTRDLQCRATRCVCKRGVLDRILADSELLLRGARFVPNRVDGQQRGFKLFAIRPDSLYAVVGLKNGDVIEKIAGLPIDNPELALQAYSAVRARSPIQVELRRHGEPMTLTFDVER